VLTVWYDNEYGYSCQVVRVIEAMAGTHPMVLPEREPVVLERELLVVE
jgi:glyceraldehyde 3-phosphate dehydrogenase